MAKCVNKAIIVGNLGRSPDIKKMPNGIMIVSISVATTDLIIDYDSGNESLKTEWHRLVFFNELAESAAKLCVKGKKIYVEGAVKTRKWIAENGSDRFSTEIVAREFQIID